MKSAHLLTAYPVKATIRIGVFEKIITGIFSSANTAEECEKYTAVLSAEVFEQQISGEIKKEGDLFYVYGSLCFTHPGQYSVFIKINDQKSTLLEMVCQLTCGSFKERLLARLLEDFAGKEADHQLYQYANRLIDMGATNDQVAGELMKSEPAMKKTIREFYLKYLDREPHEKEWAPLLKQLRGEEGIEGLKNLILSSKEYYSNAGQNNNEGFLRALNRDLTGSDVLLPGYNGWLYALDNKSKTVSEIISEFQTSLPAVFHAAAGYYTQFYHRTPHGSELKDIVNKVKSHKTGIDQLGVMFNAPTYFEPPFTYQVPRNLVPDGKVPDYTFQFYLNLEQASSLADGKDVRQVMLNAIKKVLADLGPKYDDQLSRDLHVTINDLIPDPELASVPWNGQENGALWFDGGENDFSLKVLDPLEPGTAYTFILSAAAIKRVMDIIWDRYPKRLNNSGKADPDGKIELRDYSISMEDNKLSIRINATYHATSVIGIGVSVTYTDIFSLDDMGVLQILSSHQLDYDSGINWIDAISALVYFITPLTFADSALTKLKIKEPKLPDFSFGAVLKGFFPTTILVPGSGSKLVFAYNNSKIVTADRIILSGIGFPFYKREPSASIGGNMDVYYPDDFKTYQVLSPTSSGLVRLKFTFYVQTQDMRGALQIKWTTDGSLSNQAGNSVDITWQFDLHRASQRYVRVHVTDEDNLKADAGKTINFLAKERKKQIPEDTPGKRIPFRQKE